MAQVVCGRFVVLGRPDPEVNVLSQSASTLNTLRVNPHEKHSSQTEVMLS